MPLEPLSQADLRDVRLIATDMDGTLTIAEKFTSQLLQALELAQMADLPVVIVTGRSAGWVSAVAYYLPIAGAICENGGLFFNPEGESELLVDIPDQKTHRQALATMFHQLQQEFPQIREASDNAFRLTDWTFDVAGLSQEMLTIMRSRCEAAGWSFVYSTVQCHIKLPQQDKAIGVKTILQRHFPQILVAQVVTMGDSPNDVSLFNAADFGQSVGVANLRRYADQMAHLPRWITMATEGEGFCELLDRLITHGILRSKSHQREF